MGLILFLVSQVLAILFKPLGFVYSCICVLVKSGYKELDRYLLNCAVSTDQSGNAYCGKLFNDILIKPGGYKFSNRDETVSSCLGKNQKLRKLTTIGEILTWVLNTLDKNHSTKSIENEP